MLIQLNVRIDDLKVIAFVTSIPVITTQSMFIGKAYIRAWRYWEWAFILTRFSVLVSNRSKKVAGLLIALVVSEFAAMMLCLIYIFKVVHVTDSGTGFVLNFGAEVTLATFNLVADLSLATTLVVLLRRRRTEFITTASIMDRITQYTIGTSLITVCLAALALACSFFENNFPFLAIVFLIPKCES